MDPIVEALTERLSSLYDASTPDEQAVLNASFAIVANADADRADVEGFSIKDHFDSSMKGLEAQDKLGNFEIQDLMSSYDQAGALGTNLFGHRTGRRR